MTHKAAISLQKRKTCVFVSTSSSCNNEQTRQPSTSSSIHSNKQHTYIFQWKNMEGGEVHAHEFLATTSLLGFKQKTGPRRQYYCNQNYKKKYKLEKHTNQSPSVENCVQSSFSGLLLDIKERKGKSRDLCVFFPFDIRKDQGRRPWKLSVGEQRAIIKASFQKSEQL